MGHGMVGKPEISRSYLFIVRTGRWRSRKATVALEFLPVLKGWSFERDAGNFCLWSSLPRALKLVGLGEYSRAISESLTDEATFPFASARIEMHN